MLRLKEYLGKDRNYEIIEKSIIKQAHQSIEYVSVSLYAMLNSVNLSYIWIYHKMTNINQAN